MNIRGWLKNSYLCLNKDEIEKIRGSLNKMGYCQNTLKIENDMDFRKKIYNTGLGAHGDEYNWPSKKDCVTKLMKEGHDNLINTLGDISKKIRRKRRRIRER